jgi:hypothetical protein
VLPVGPDTYTITENAILSFGGAVTAQEKATRTATDYCAHQGRQFLTLNYQTSPKVGSEGRDLLSSSSLAATALAALIIDCSLTIDVLPPSRWRRVRDGMPR